MRKILTRVIATGLPTLILRAGMNQLCSELALLVPQAAEKQGRLTASHFRPPARKSG